MSVVFLHLLVVRGNFGRFHKDEKKKCCINALEIRPFGQFDQQQKYENNVLFFKLNSCLSLQSEEEESLAVFLSRVPPVLVMKDEQSRLV